MARIRVNRHGRGKHRRTLRIRRKAAKHALTVDVACALNVTSPSSKTTRSRTDRTGCTVYSRCEPSRSASDSDYAGSNTRGLRSSNGSSEGDLQPYMPIPRRCMPTPFRTAGRFPTADRTRRSACRQRTHEVLADDLRRAEAGRRRTAETGWD